MSAVECKQVSKSFRDPGSEDYVALKNINIKIEKGEFTVILGPSGAGKSTLLNLIGGLEPVSSGEIEIFGQKISGFSEKQLANYRAEKVGFIFQNYNLLPTLNVMDNVKIIKDLAITKINFDEVIKAVGLESVAKKFPGQLSGGQQQRVSIARALAKDADLLLCDEPTGALDSKTGIQITKILKDLCINEGKTVIVVTHNEKFGLIANRILKVKDGAIESNIINTTPVSVSEVDW